MNSKSEVWGNEDGVMMWSNFSGLYNSMINEVIMLWISQCSMDFHLSLNSWASLARLDLCSIPIIKSCMRNLYNMISFFDLHYLVIHWAISPPYLLPITCDRNWSFVPYKFGIITSNCDPVLFIAIPSWRFSVTTMGLLVFVCLSLFKRVRSEKARSPKSKCP